MKKHIILAGTILAAVALCWTLGGGTAKVETVPAPAAESHVSAPCAPQTQPSEPSSNIIITEPETVPVTGSAASLESEYPQTTPTAVSEPTPAEEPAAELPATISKPAPTEEPVAEQPTTILEPAPTEDPITKTSQPQDGMVYVPGFGYLQSEGPGEWSVSEGMYENGNKVGIMG